MRLSELTAYAKAKYRVVEQFGLAGLPPEASVLIDPETRRWTAVLTRRRDPATGEVAERCDIKCGRQILSVFLEPWLTFPFWSRGQDWVGVEFGDDTKPEIVFQLFDKAVCDVDFRGVTVVLEPKASETSTRFRETSLPFLKSVPFEEDESIPLKIRQMRRLYEYGDGSFRQKCRNFYTQGKFMEDYEDDYPWQGELRPFLPTYHDMNVDQLRGYFTWRARTRKGIYQKICDSAAYVYLYELINGVGVSSVEDCLRKAKEFETGYLDSGLGGPNMRANLRQWMLELSIINGIAPEKAREFVDDETRERDAATSVLRAPEERSDRQIFDALNFFDGAKLASSIVVKKHGDEGIRLFAETWRVAWKERRHDDKNFFTECFGNRRGARWFPLGGAPYYERRILKPATYELNDCRKYVFMDGIWKVYCYQTSCFNKKTFDDFLRETDRRLRLYLKTGRPLQNRAERAWAAPWVEAVIEADRQAKLESARPRVVIRFDDLEQIRRDALATQDSLLTDEDRQELACAAKEAESADVGNEASPTLEIEAPTGERVVEQGEEAAFAESLVPLDDDQRQTLCAILRGESVRAMIAAKHGTPEIVADALNEALYDELGDSAVECDGEDIYLVEDYRDDIVRILGGTF